MNCADGMSSAVDRILLRVAPSNTKHQHNTTQHNNSHTTKHPINQHTHITICISISMFTSKKQRALQEIEARRGRIETYTEPLPIDTATDIPDFLSHFYRHILFQQRNDEGDPRSARPGILP